MAGILLFSSCGGVINLPVPSINTLSPATIAQESTTLTLTVMGSGFAPSSVVTFNTQPRPTIFLSETELTTLVNPSDVVTSGTVDVDVTTPPPGGGTSNVVTLTIAPIALPVPRISSITPEAIDAGGAGGNTITITGTNFVGVPGESVSVATVNGANRPTGFVSGSELTVTLQDSDILTAGPVQIAVLNPPAANLKPPGGGVSNSLALSVVNPNPVLASVSPDVVVAGTTTTTEAISVSGSGFDSASQVLINGTGRPTTSASSTSVSAQLASGDVAAAGTYTVQVINPPPGGGASQLSFFSVVPSATGAGLPALVDVAPDGAQANDGASPPSQVGPSMDSSGRFVAFASSSTNVLETTTINPPPNPLNNGTSNIFLRDTCLGVTTSCTPREILVDLGPDNVIANGPSSSPVVNTNGASVVAYVSLGTDLVSGFTFDGTTSQVFLTNPCVQVSGGCTVTTSLISVGANGVSVGSGASEQPSISAEGRFVAFSSTATNLAAGATTGAQEVYLRDTCLGQGSTCTPKTYLVSQTPGGGPADGASSEPIVVSGKAGQFVAFTSTATNLLSGSSGSAEIYRVRFCIGITKGCTASSAQLISTPNGTTFADGSSVEPTMTPDGRVIAFASTATVLGLASGGTQQIYERDTCQGVPSGCTARTVAVSVASGGAPGNALSESPSVGNTGQFVAFSSLASNLVTASANGLESVYVRNSCVEGLSGCTPSTAFVGQSANKVAGNGASVNPVISGAGHIVCFYSAASNLVNNDLNGFPDIFLGITTF